MKGSCQLKIIFKNVFKNFRLADRVNSLYDSGLNKLNQLSIRNRLIIFILIISIVPILLMGIVSYEISRTAITTKIANYSVQELTQSAKILELTLKKYQEFSSRYIADEDLNKTVDSFVFAANNAAAFDSYNKLRNSFVAFASFDDSVSNILFYSINGNRNIKYQMWWGDHEIKRQSFYREAIRSGGRIVWGYYKNSIVLCRVINSSAFLKVGQPLGIMLITIKEESINKLINSYTSDFREDSVQKWPYTLIINENGIIIDSPIKKLFGQKLARYMGNPKMVETILSEEASDNKFPGIFNGQAVLFTYQPIPDKGWYMVSVAPNSYLYTESTAVMWWALLIGVGICSVAIVISYNFAMGISNPLNRVMTAMKQAESGDLSVRVDVRSQDELGRLGNSFNYMISRINELTQLAHAYTELKENQEKLVITEKMASLGRLASGIAHEMNTPLAAVRATLMELSQLVDEFEQSIGIPQVLPEDYKAIAKDMAANLKLATEATEKSVSFIRGIKGQTLDLSSTPLQTFRIAPVITDTLNIIEFALKKSQCQVVVNLDDTIQIYGNPRWLSQIVSNLALNAIDACKPGGGMIQITLGSNHETAVLEVQDSGCGILPENLTRIFDPLFTTKPFGEGTGLGLNIVRDLVNQFKGEIEVASKPGFTKFTVTIPLEKGSN